MQDRAIERLIEVPIFGALLTISLIALLYMYKEVKESRNRETEAHKQRVEDAKAAYSQVLQIHQQHIQVMASMQATLEGVKEALSEQRDAMRAMAEEARAPRMPRR